MRFLPASSKAQYFYTSDGPMSPLTITPALPKAVHPSIKATQPHFSMPALGVRLSHGTTLKLAYKPTCRIVLE